MPDSAVSEFLTKVSQDDDLRRRAQDAYRDSGSAGLVQLGADEGLTFTASDLDAVMSPKEDTSDGKLGVAIGWS